MSPDELKAPAPPCRRWRMPRRGTNPLDRAGSGRWRWRRASGIVTASITPSWPRLAPQEPRQPADCVGGALPHLDEQLFQCKSTFAQAEAAALKAGHLAGGAGRPAGGGGSLAAALVISSAQPAAPSCVPSPRASPWSGCCWRPTPSSPSSPRYRLERVPGTDLALQVVDLDMGTRCARWIPPVARAFGVAGAGAGALQPVVTPDPGRIAVHR